MTTYTPNLQLEKYEGTDKAVLTDQYNSSMDILDKAVTDAGSNLDAARTDLQNQINADVNNLTATNAKVAALETQTAETKTTADNAMSLAQTNEADIATNDGEIAANKTAIAANKGEIDTLNAEMEGLGITSVTGAQSFLATVNGHTTSIARQGELIAENQADIAELKAKPSGGVNLTRETLQISDEESPEGVYTFGAAYDPNTNIFEIYGEILPTVSRPSVTASAIPGTSIYGVATDRPSSFRPLKTHVVKGCGVLFDANKIPHLVDAAIDTSGYVYVLAGYQKYAGSLPLSSLNVVYTQSPLYLDASTAVS